MNRVISDNYVTGDNIYLRELQNFFFEVLGMMSITHYGAIGDGRRDNYGPLQVAIDDAHRRGLSFLYVPYGRFIYTGELINIGDLIFIGNPHAHIVNIRTGEEIEIKQFGSYKVDVGDNYYTKEEVDELIGAHVLDTDMVLVAGTSLDMASGIYYTGDHQIFWHEAIDDIEHLLFDKNLLVYWDNGRKLFSDEIKVTAYDTVYQDWYSGDSGNVTSIVSNVRTKVPTAAAVYTYVNEAIDTAITQAIGGAY